MDGSTNEDPGFHLIPPRSHGRSLFRRMDAGICDGTVLGSRRMSWLDTVVGSGVVVDEEWGAHTVRLAIRRLKGWERALVGWRTEMDLEMGGGVSG